MSSENKNIADHLQKIGIPVSELKISTKKFMVLGIYNPELQPVFDQLSTYSRTGSDCAIETQRELNKGRANGYFETEHAPNHWVPCVAVNNKVIAYDSLSNQSFDNIFFVGSTDEVIHYLNIFFTTYYPYGGKFEFHTGNIFNYPV
jgi:uncharacterized protein involved in high-affinity Fe2+ transport